MPASRPEALRPVSLRKEGDDGFVIEWNDAHRSTYTWKHLRDHCPCASCRGEHDLAPDPFHILKPSELVPRPPLAPVSITPVGYYAYKFVWNDGHDTGLYTLENLRELCQCPQCRPTT